MSSLPLFLTMLTVRLVSNAIVMHTGSGDYPLICPHLVRALSARGLWMETIRDYLQRRHGACGSPGATCMLISE